MGTDCYLGWKGKTKDEENAQITGWSTTDGDKGYLRASIGMIAENRLLRELFPNQYWENEGKAIPYAFNEEQWNKLNKLGIYYLMCQFFNKEFKVGDDKATNYMAGIVEGLNRLANNDKNVKILTPETQGDFPFAVGWLNSVFDFFYMGAKLQEEKKEPTVYISW